MTRKRLYSYLAATTLILSAGPTLADRVVIGGGLTQTLTTSDGTTEIGTSEEVVTGGMLEGDTLSGIITFTSSGHLNVLGEQANTTSSAVLDLGAQTLTTTLLSCSGSSVLCGSTEIGQSLPTAEVITQFDGIDTISYVTPDDLPRPALDPFLLYPVATIQLAPVPVPAAAWLFGSALVGLAGIKRRCA